MKMNLWTCFGGVSRSQLLNLAKIYINHKILAIDLVELRCAKNGISFMRNDDGFMKITEDTVLVKETAAILRGHMVTADGYFIPCRSDRQPEGDPIRS